MVPSFGRLFGETIPAYFTLLMLGFGLATFVAARWAKRSGLDHDVIIDLGLVALLSGVAGGRILHVLADGYFWDYVHLCTDPSQVIWRTVDSAAECTRLEGAWNAGARECHAVQRNCFAWAEFWSGGLAYYGGLITASVTCIWFLKREGFPLAAATDIAGAVIPLGIFFGRLGCFFGGCCFGVPTDGPLGMVFPAHSPASEMQMREGLLASKALPSLPVHPTQLYEAAGCLAIATYLLLWLHPRKRFDYQVFLAFIGLYGVLRFGVEYLRADDRGGVLALSTSQWLSVLMLVGAGVLWAKLSKRPAPGAAA